jgi:hypothetical protein
MYLILIKDKSELFCHSPRTFLLQIDHGLQEVHQSIIIDRVIVKILFEKSDRKNLL